MGKISYGFRVLFRIWRDDAFAEQVQSLEEGKLIAKAEAAPPPAPAPAARRSDAITLLAVLQREARLVDFLQEPIANYSDAQVGAAVREVHKGCSTAVQRMFDLRPLLDAAEGSQAEAPKGFDPARFRLTGNVKNEPPFRGKLCHHGWQAGKCELPEWTGSEGSALVVAPAELELT